MPVEKRSYGQGSQGELDPKQAAKPSIVQRLRYLLDAAVGKSGIFLAILLPGSIVLAVIVTALSYLNGTDPHQDPRFLDPNKQDFFARFWMILMLVVYGGGRPDGTALDRTLAVVLWCGTILVTTFIGGFVFIKLLEITNKLKRGHSNVIASEHTLVLGWSNRIFPLLQELNTAHKGSKHTVVILSERERPLMDDELEARVGKLANLKLVTRTGDVNNPRDLERVNTATAKSVVLLDSDSSSDASIVATMLAIKSVGATKVPVIAEIDDPKIGRSLVTATAGQVVPVRSDEIIARVTAQASRQIGLAAVVLDLLDFDGSEIYFTNVPALVGKTYGEALISFNDSAVIGVISADGISHVNPAVSYKLSAGDKLIVIAEDDTKVTYSGVQDSLLKRTPRAAKAAVTKPANLLVIGWSFMGEAVLRELSAFLPKGSNVTIATNKELVGADALKGTKWGNLKVSHKLISGEVDELVAISKGQKFDEIIVLGYRKGITAADADAHTMLTMLQLNQLKLISKSGEATRLIAEILDSRKASLARVAAEGDLVISDNLGALLIAQLSENPALAAIFEDLFGAGGSSILINPIENYASLGKSVSFGELVAAASDRGESAIGYRTSSADSLDGSTGVVLNPAKSAVFNVKAGDSLVVIGKC
ncbi:MAG: CASTOR/POLLUX-related putative ion channel [Micrococcales bacterium]